MYHLPILSLREFLELTEKISLSSYSLDDILSNHEPIANEIIDTLHNKKILKHFNHFINVGVYPFYFEDESKYIDRVHENINTILYTDLVNVVKIDASKIESLKRLLLSICKWVVKTRGLNR